MICCSASGVGRVFKIENDINNVEYILLEVERPFLGEQRKQVNDYLPLYDWNDRCKRFSYYIEEGDIIAFKGRIETKNEIGVIIVCEQVRVILKGKK